MESLIHRVGKVCTKCGRWKQTDQFVMEKTHRDGRSSACKVCNNERINKWKKEHTDMVREDKKKWHAENIEKSRESEKRWRRNHPEKTRDMTRNWRQKNPAKLKMQRKNYKRKLLSTPRGKLNNVMCGGINHALKNGTKAGRHWTDLVNFTVDQLKQHLEKLFTTEMTWENYGTVWEIDHKIPIAVFNFEIPEDIDFRLCWSLKNLQPLRKTENRSKNNKIDKPFQPSLTLAATGG